MAGGTDGPPLHTRLLQKLKGDASTDWLSRSIFKVPNHLRRISRQAYEPQVISIGPYHHGKGQLKKMEVYKMFYLKELLERRPDISLEDYVTALKVKEKEARECYSEPLNHIGGEKFVEMMLLDGCFIVELIRKRAVKKLRHKNDHLLTHSILRRVMLDLLLVENQIPISILSELFDMTVVRNYEAKDFKDIAIEFFSDIMPGSLRIPRNQDIKNLLGLVHASSQAPSLDCPEVHISCLPEKVIRLLCPEVMLKAMAIPCLSSSSSKSAEEDEESKLAENRKEQTTQMPPPSMAAPLVCSSPPKSSEEVNFPHSDSDNLLFRAAAAAAAAASTNFSQPKSPEELRFPPPKAMTIPSSSLSKSLEEIVSTAALSVGASASNSLKVAKSPPSDSSLPRSQEEMDEKAVRKNGDSPSVCFPPSDSSNPFYPEEMGEPAVELSELPFKRSLPLKPKVSKKGAAPSVIFPPSDSGNPFHPEEMARSLPPKPQLDSKGASDPNWRKWRFIRSATELSEAGINFKKIEGRLFDIKFQKGVMLIPTLSINDDTESILRNLVAYEQRFKGASSKCFTDYITFMDYLINTGKDVELLCLREVIDNWLGDHDVVADIFNKLRDSVLISEEDFSYAETFRKVNKHCDRKWNQWKANLWHNYFNTPWAAISLFAAVFLLLLTVLQSVYAVLSYQFK